MNIHPLYFKFSLKIGLNLHFISLHSFSLYFCLEVFFPPKKQGVRRNAAITESFRTVHRYQKSTQGQLTVLSDVLKI